MKLVLKKNRVKFKVMTKKQDQTASFMVRFNQRIFEENGESKLQWRGKISHIQDGEEKCFSDFDDALTFMQKKLGELTEEATKYHSY
jgi:predicted small secreted protein